MAVINIDDAYILNETGAQVDKVTGLFTKDEDTTSGEKAFAQLNIGTAGSNRNLLDNPWFTVNQRGLTTMSSASYAMDRWKCDNAVTNGMVYSDGVVTLASNTVFAQRIEPTLMEFLKGKTVTASLLKADGTVVSATNVVNSSGSTAFPYVGGIDLSPIRFRVVGGVAIKAVKLELGSVSTLANDAPPDYWQELDKCLYYFERITNNGSSPITIGAGFADGVNNLYVPVHIHRKRAGIATISTSGAIYAGQRSSNISVSSVTQYNSSPDGIITLLAVTPSSFTSNEYYRLALGAGAHIDFSADL